MSTTMDAALACLYREPSVRTNSRGERRISLAGRLMGPLRLENVRSIANVNKANCRKIHPTGDCRIEAASECRYPWKYSSHRIRVRGSLPMQARKNSRLPGSFNPALVRGIAEAHQITSPFPNLYF